MHDPIEVTLANIHSSRVGKFDANAIAMHIDDSVWIGGGRPSRVHSILQIGEAEAREKQSCEKQASPHTNAEKAYSFWSKSGRWNPLNSASCWPEDVSPSGPPLKSIYN